MQLCHRECFESERSWSRRNEASWRSECDRFASSDDAPPRYLRGPDESELNRLTLEEETRRYFRLINICIVRVPAGIVAGGAQHFYSFVMVDISSFPI